jgi:DNA-directed RNA polymerase specialized sigma24 family protein
MEVTAAREPIGLRRTATRPQDVGISATTILGPAKSRMGRLAILSALFDEFQPVVYRHLFYVTGDATAAEALTGGVFARLAASYRDEIPALVSRPLMRQLGYGYSIAN